MRPDLVRGLGEIYPCGDIVALAVAPRRALSWVGDLGLVVRLRQRVAGYSIEVTALGFEWGAHAALVPEATGPLWIEGDHGRSTRKLNMTSSCNERWWKWTLNRSQQPVDGQPGVPVGGEAGACPLGAARPHLGEPQRLSQQLREHRRQRRHGLVSGRRPGRPFQVGGW
jgi:hypothetical protein